MKSTMVVGVWLAGFTESYYR